MKKLSLNNQLNKKVVIPLTGEMDKFYSSLKASAPSMLGYPGNLNNDFSKLYNFFDFIINNVGDPYGTEASYRMHSKEYEKKVLEFFRKVYNFDSKSFWGYLTSGGTEGNLMGLLMGRIKYPEGIVYSTDGHYSIKKNSVILNMPYTEIKTYSNGEIDYKDLFNHLSKDSRPPIINLTIGTTFDGAIDSVDKVLSILKKTSHKNFYIHCDAALFGGFLPFLGVKHELNFNKPINSISISAHKFFGVPFPSGIFLSKEKPQDSFVKKIDYINEEDTTISGSRNGQLALFLWALIKYKGKKGFKKDALMCIKNAKYLEKSLKKINYNPQLNKNSNIVTFNIPSDKVLHKWQLATKGKRAHVVVMQHITKETIDLLISDIIFM